jgi:hypothetical protein
MAIQNTPTSTGLRIWEILVGTLSYFVAGSQFIVLGMTLHLNVVAKCLLLILGPLLLLCAPISVIFVLWEYTMPIASKIFALGKPVLFAATIVSLTNAMIGIVQLFGGNGWQSSIYLCYLLAFLVLFIVVMIVIIVRDRRKNR